MATIWQRRRKAAREAGEYHADGGPDTRAHHAAQGKDCAEAYADAYADRVAHHERNMLAEQERVNHPLSNLAMRAEALAYRGETPEVAELARMIAELAQYIVEKESE